MKIIFTSIVFLVFCINTMAQDPAYPPGPAASLNIVKAEYFFDSDPGFGLATDIPLSVAMDIPNLMATVSIAGLPAGAHTLIVRTLNAEGNWSITSTKPIGIDPDYPVATQPALNIVKAEYFVNDDPGFGMATDIPITAATDIANLPVTVNINGLPAGAHNLIVRTQNAEGEWSITSTKTFGIDPNYPLAVPAALNIVKAEYFVDTDPGFGMATDLPLTSAVDIPSLVANVNISSLAIGAHNLILRSQNAEGEWSITSVEVFGIDPAYPPAPPTIGNITRIEYFFDTDPGFGNGTAATITPATEIANLDITAGLAGLSAGTHKFYIRCLDDWSLTSVKDISLPADVLPLTLLSFEGKSLGADVLLNWKTANEKDFSHFEIQRSENGKVFEKIGEKSSGESGNYDFLDSTTPPGSGGQFYRLSMVDIDGSNTVSKIIYIVNNFEKSSIGQFYPNPSFKKSSIEIVTKESSTWDIATFDLTGKLINKETKFLQKGINTVKFESLATGLNYVKFENGKTIQIRKVLKH